MEFCSKYGYDYGHDGSDNEEISVEEEQTKQKVKRKIRKADSNIIAVKFDELVMTNEMFAGDPIYCKKCEAILSSLSKESINIDEVSKTKTWICEFCYESNDISELISSLDEIPKNDNTTFLLEAATASSAQIADKNLVENKNLSEDNSYLTFCIDISGSMDTNIQIENPVNLAKAGHINSQYKNSSITRLEGVKMACAENLNQLKEQEPKKESL